MPAPTRTPDEIRASIEANRAELGTSLVKLRGEVVRMTDWRSQLRRSQPQLTAGAAATGFVLGGGLAEPEVRALHHHVGGDDGHAVRAHDRGVVAEPAHDACVLARRERRADGEDQVELTDGGRRSAPG